MPIVIAPQNQELTIIKIMVDEKTKKHLESLGITISSKITLLSENMGSVIVLVKGVRLALNKSIAMKILVV